MFKIDIPNNAEYILNILDFNNTFGFVVGGCVRDSLLGKEPHDWDICTSAKPEEVLKLMKRNQIRTIETGLQHGTVTAVVNDESYEITTYRVDGEYTDIRRPDRVTFVTDLMDDLSRRDFTINAMAYNYYEGLVDPWNGSYDLHAGLIRCVGNPDKRFNEDGLRILRALRFASTYGFKIEEKTAEAIHRNKDLLKNISAERIQSELTKILCGMGVLDILLEYKDVMAIIIPELEPCIGFEQNNPYHIYDVYDHIAHAVANYIGPDVSIKMALLLHDIGKPECYSEDEKGGHFYGHGINSRDIAERVMTRLKFDNKTKEEVITLVLYHDADIHPGFRSVKRWLNKIGYETLRRLIDIKLADIKAHSLTNRWGRVNVCFDVLELTDTIVKEQQCFTIKDLAINGHDVMSLGIEAGPKVGKVLKHLLNKVIDEELSNERDKLIEEATVYLKGE